MEATPIRAGLQGGWTPYPTFVSAATTNATLVTSVPGQVQSIRVTNTNTTNIRVVRFCDSASAPVPGTSTPIITVIIPAGTAANIPATKDINFVGGVQFTKGIGFWITGAVGNADTTAVSAGDVYLDFNYFSG